MWEHNYLDELQISSSLTGYISESTSF